ncbi:hypothetical protein BaRGS_00028559, partial [Batillaria attramentaria]
FVQSVHWSFSVDHDTCYMAAVHQQNVTVWRVSGAVPRLAFKQVRKINVQPIPQGCLWNPVSDVLCLLSRQQCSFYFRHVQNRGSFAFPALENEKIMCGCWSPDGKRLVICVGSALLIYTWSDLEANISDFVTAAWRIPGVSGSITAVVPASANSLVCASDLPLDALCRNKDVDTFLMPGAGGSHTDGNDILRPQAHASVRDRLLNLQPNPTAQVKDTAMLSLVKLPAGLQDPSVMASTIVPGLLSPDLLHFQVESQCVVVGSNAQNELQVFALLDNHLLPSGHLTLAKEQRPKGICGLHTSQVSSAYGVLVLVGTSEPTDPTFPTANNLSPFSLSLKFFATRQERARQFANGHASSHKSHTQSSSVLVKSESLREQKSKSISDSRLQTRQSSYKGERPDHRLRSPDRGHDTSPDPQIKMTLSRIDSVDAVPQLVEEVHSSSSGRLVQELNGSPGRGSDTVLLETERTDFSQSAPQFGNSKLSQKFEMGQREQRRSNVKQDSPRTSVLSKETSHTTNGNTAEAKVRHSHVSNGHSTVQKDHVHSSGKSLTADRGHGAPFDGVSVRQKETTVSPQLPRPVGDRVGRVNTDDAGSVCSSFNSSDSNYEVLERQIQQQRDHIDALQKRLDELSVMVEDSACVFPVHYQKMSEPEVISIQCVVGGARVSRRFLLDNGRLQLEPLKQAFGLLTVELILDGEPLVLGANIDGYIPMRFSSGSVLQVTGIPVTYSPQLPRAAHKDGSKC